MFKPEMHAKLCDRCLTCAHEILIKYDFKTQFETKRDAVTHIKYLLSYVNGDFASGPLHIEYEMNSLNYGFLTTRCENCENIPTNCYSCYSVIRIYIKTCIVKEIFRCVIENNFRDLIIGDQNLLGILKIKLITIHISTLENAPLVYYYNQNLINYYDLKTLPYFEELDYLPIYFEKIFKIPIYLANMNINDYLNRKKLGLEEKIKNHPLCKV